MKEDVSTDAVKHLFRVAYLALLVSFYQLYNLGAVRTPHDWLYLQLSGGASRIKGIILHFNLTPHASNISFTANFILLKGIPTDMLDSAIAKGCSYCQRLIHVPFIFIMDEAQELFELKLQRMQHDATKNGIQVYL